MGGSGEINGEKCQMCEKIYELRDSLKQKSAEILDNLFDPTEKE
jgi:hypothetical protein